jgi:hypothetical protein
MEFYSVLKKMKLCCLKVNGWIGQLHLRDVSQVPLVKSVMFSFICGNILFIKYGSAYSVLKL